MKVCVTLLALLISVAIGVRLLAAQTTDGMVPFTMDHRRAGLSTFVLLFPQMAYQRRDECGSTIRCWGGGAS